MIKVKIVQIKRRRDHNEVKKKSFDYSYTSFIVSYFMVFIQMLKVKMIRMCQPCKKY